MPIAQLPYDVNAPSERLQWHRVLLALHQVGGKVESLSGLAARELMDRTGVKLGNPPTPISNAEAKGFLTRKLNGKRTYKIELTDAGRDHLTTTLIPRYKVEPEPEPTPELEVVPEPVAELPAIVERQVVVKEEDSRQQVSITLTGTPREMAKVLTLIDKAAPDSRLDGMVASVHHLDRRVDGMSADIDAMYESHERMVQMVTDLHAVWCGEMNEGDERSNVVLPAAAPPKRQRTASISRIADSAAALRKVTNKDWKAMYRSAAEQGCVFTPVSNGHIKVTFPDGSSKQVPGTPSEYRGLKNQRADFRRRGIAV